MQSIDILIVIVLIHYRARTRAGDCGRCASGAGVCEAWPAEISVIQNDGVQKRLQPMKKKKRRHAE